jgi:topoisomerase-4 subunit A
MHSGADPALGRRRTTIAEAAPSVAFNPDAMIEKEPVTVILSQRGWIRAARGHVQQEWKFKEGDGPAFEIHAQTTDKLLLAADDGRFFTVGADKLPGARGFGEPIRNTLDIDSTAQIVAVLVHKPGQKLLLAADTGRGFAAVTDELLAETRKGRQVVNLRDGAKLAVVHPIPAGHDHVAVVGDNRKLVVFNLEELPEMSRGQGVTLQRYRDGGLADATTLKLEEGLSWKMGGDTGRVRTESDMRLWKVARGAAGRLPPTGFPRDNKF